MRITVYDVLSYLAAGMTSEEILACLSYAADREQRMLVARG